MLTTVRTLSVTALTVITIFGAISNPALALKELKSGTKAPDFQLVDVNGVKHTLSEHTKKGEIVVLEWLNFGCPYVQKHYKANKDGARNMPTLQTKYMKQGVVWFSIVSSAPGEEGYLDTSKPEEKAKALAAIKLNENRATAVLLDPDGKVGTDYGAPRTPNMVVIDKSGILAYQGAIDSNDSDDIKTLAGATNYVVDALEALLAKPPQKVKVDFKKAYGCGVKYKK